MFGQITFFPETASTFAEKVDALNWFMVLVCGFFAVLIAILVSVFAIRYRRSRASKTPPPLAEKTLKLEIAWSVIPLVLAMIMFGWGAVVYLTWATPPKDALEIYVVGQQWMWKMQHLGGQREINTLHVPVGRPVKLTITSQDVIHSFYVPAFRTHMDAVPGRYTTAWFQATKPGSYHLFCTEYCGTDHSAMIGRVIVMEKEEFQAWLAEGGDNSMAMRGRKLFQKLQCVVCHSADASARGPSLENIYEARVPLRDGGFITADQTYLRESILAPDAKVVAGFQPIMPSFKGLVTEEELLELVTFLKGLGPGQTPSRIESSEPPIATPAEQKEKKK